MRLLSIPSIEVTVCVVQAEFEVLNVLNGGAKLRGERVQENRAVLLGHDTSADCLR